MARTRYHDPQSAIFHRPILGQADSHQLSSDEIERNRFYKHLLEERLHQELKTLAGSDLDLELAIRRAENEPIRLTAKRLNLDPSTVSRRGKKAIERIQIGVLAKLTREQILRYGRVVVSANHPRMIDPKVDSFIIALAGYNEALTTIPDSHWIAKWLTKRWHTIQASVGCADGISRMPHIHIWYRDGQGEINLSIVVESESVATTIANENKREFIHDVATGRMITFPPYK